MALSNVTLNSNLLLITLQESSRDFSSFNGSSFQFAIIQNKASDVTTFDVGDIVMVNVPSGAPAFVEISGTPYYIINLDQVYLREDPAP